MCNINATIIGVLISKSIKPLTIAMVLSIDELRNTVTKYKQEGLSTEQIADELSLSQSTILWLLTSNSEENISKERPIDIRIGWRTIGARPTRVAALPQFSQMLF